MTRRIQPQNLLPRVKLSVSGVPKIIEVMLQRPYGVRGLGSLRFRRRLWGISKMSCVWLSTRVCILITALARVCNHVTRLLAIVAYDLGHVSLVWCTSRASRLKILTIGSMSRSMFSLIWSTLSNIRSTPSTQPGASRVSSDLTSATALSMSGGGTRCWIEDLTFSNSGLKPIKNLESPFRLYKAILCYMKFFPL